MYTIYRHCDDFVGDHMWTVWKYIQAVPPGLALACQRPIGHKSSEPGANHLIKA